MKQINLSSFSVVFNIIFVNCESIVYPLDVIKENRVAMSFMHSKECVWGLRMAKRHAGLEQQQFELLLKGDSFLLWRVLMSGRRGPLGIVLITIIFL